MEKEICRLIRKSVREFAINEIKPLAAKIDQTGEYPKELFNKMAENNYMGITLPKEYGGVNLGYEALTIVLEEIASVCGSSTMHLTSPNTLVGHTILKFGSEEQKEKYLTPIATGKKVGTFALSEPNAGSDAVAIEATAKKDGDYYIINGRKTFITSAPNADYIVAFAITDKMKGARGVTAFFIDKDAIGFSTGMPENKMGMNGSKTSDIILEDVKVHKSQILGLEGMGFIMAMSGLDSGRVGVAAQSVGIAQGAMNEALKFVKNRRQFGQRIADFQGIRFMLADMETRINAARLLVYNAAKLLDKGKKITKEAAMAKYYASETAFKVASDALQLHGGYGYTKDYPIERMFRESRVTTIYEGTSQIQQIVIAKEILK